MGAMMTSIRKYKVNLYAFIQLLILGACIFVEVLLVHDNSSLIIDKKLMIVAWMSNIVFIWDLYVFYKAKRNILDFSLIFFVFFFLFCNGQVMLYSLGYEPSRMLIFKVSSLEEIYEASVYFLFSMILFCLGAIAPMYRHRELNKVKKIDNQGLVGSIYSAGILLLIISIVPYLYIFLTKSITSIIYGYSALYRNAIQVSGVIGYISKLFIPSLFMIMYAKYDNKTLRRFVYVILLIIAGICLLSGNRGDGLSIIITLVVFRQLYGNEFKGKNIIRLVIIALAVLIITPLIASFRSMQGRGIADLGQLFLESVRDEDKNLIISAISELGGTTYAFILTKRAIPALTGFKLGQSYIASFFMIIPSQLLGGFSFAKYAALDIWLQNIHKMTYGPGFSITAETYYNFGWMGGIVFSYFLGLFFTKMFNMKSVNQNKNEVLRLLSLIFLYNSIIVARFPFHNTIRNIVYIYIIPYLLIMFFYRRSQDKVRS